MDLVIQIRGLGPDPVGPGAGEEPSPDDPATKLEANYRPAEVENQTCGTCAHFARNRCELVVGVVDADYVCDWWKELGQSRRRTPVGRPRSAGVSANRPGSQSEFLKHLIPDRQRNP